MSDPWTQAWAEAEASNPTGIVVYDTIELIHSELPGNVRVVNGTHENQLFTLEDGAPSGGGTEVEFTAVEFWAERPEFAEGQTPSCKIAIDGVGDELVPYLENATTIREDLIAIYRQFRSDDTSEPCYGPIQFVIKNVKSKNARLEGTAQLKNLANVRFPSKVFTYDEFPGLANG